MYMFFIWLWKWVEALLVWKLVVNMRIKEGPRLWWGKINGKKTKISLFFYIVFFFPIFPIFVSICLHISYLSICIMLESMFLWRHPNSILGLFKSSHIVTIVVNEKYFDDMNKHLIKSRNWQQLKEKKFNHGKIYL